MALAETRNVIPSVSANFTRCSQLRNSLLQFVSTGNYSKPQNPNAKNWGEQARVSLGPCGYREGSMCEHMIALRLHGPNSCVARPATIYGQNSAILPTCPDSCLSLFISGKSTNFQFYGILSYKDKASTAQ
jgi:hypothetical protein